VEKQNIAIFSENAQYTILVFYVENRSEEGDMVVSELLSLGYRSSGIPTDFSELGKYKERHKPGEIWISYTDKGNHKLDEVRTVLSSNNLSVKGASLLRTMKRCDIQILLF